jgi:chloramphenicol 3-O-phosphotransferase
MPDPGHGRLVLITGATAAGKTTVGHEVAALLPRSMHVDGDDIHRLIVSGAVDFDLPPPPGAVEQLMLRYSAAMAVSNVYRHAGFDAILSDNIFEAHLTGLLFLAFADVPTESVHVVVLDPPADVIWRRYQARPGGGYSDTITPEGLTRAVARTLRIGLWLDNGHQTPAETAASIVSRLDEAAVTQQDLLSRLNAPVSPPPSWNPVKGRL